MKTICSILIWGSFLMAQPRFNAQFRVTYKLDTARDAQLSVLTINDLGFNEALGPFLTNTVVPDLTPIYPVALVISNTGKHAVGYLNVRYTYVFQDGTEHVGDILYSRNPIIGDQFAPGQQILIHPAMGSVGNHRTSANQKMVAQLVDLLAKCAAVVVSIDAISWNDGTIWGEDRGGIRQMYRSDRAAVLDAYLETGGRRPVREGDGIYSHTRERVTKYALTHPGSLKEMLDQFAPLKGEN